MYIGRQVNSKVFPGRLNDVAVEKSSLVASFGVYLEARVEGPQQVVFKSPKVLLLVLFSQVYRNFT